jgi:dipicolinate synthase subunit A
VTIIDIASAPGGVDFSAAQKMGISAFLCSGLPGKYAPASSASAIQKIIEKKEDNLCL